MRKWPMWRKRQKNYVHTPDRSQKRLNLLRTPIEIDLDRHPDGTPFTNDDYPSVAMVPYEGDEPYCCTSDEDCWCDPSGRDSRDA